LSVNRYISEATQNKVRQRAKYLCEYCHASEQWQYVPFTVDHVIPLNKGSVNSIENFALACFHCNRQKSDKVIVIEEATGAEVVLFNPRIDFWEEHFIWSANALRIIALTATGRVTVAILAFNRERIINIRAADK
jgi:HNH endonuclease